MHFSSSIDVIVFIVEIIACVSFATSGTIKAMRKNADVLGVVILSLIETFGGGLLRDLIINQGAPHIFWDEEYLILAGVTALISLILFFVAYFKKSSFFLVKHRNDFWIHLLDAVGIAIFCISGCRVADNSIATATFKDQINIVGIYVYDVSLGVITGVGGGMFRDVFLGDIPMVFRKHFYMTPCIIGSLAFTLMYRLLGSGYYILCLAVSFAIIVGFRVLAIVYRWNLPSVKTPETTQGKQ